MATLNLTGSEFADVVVCFILDKLQHPTDVVEFDLNPKFNALAEVLGRRGMKAAFLQVYMSMDPQTRVKYRLIRDVFRDVPGGSIEGIQIHKDERKKEMEVGIFAKIKKFVKKLLVVVAVAGAAKLAAGQKEVEEPEDSVKKKTRGGK